MKHRGFTLIEVLSGLIIFGVVLTALFVCFIRMWGAQGISIGMPASQQGAEQIVFKLGNSFRGAAVCQATDSGCVLGSGIQNASSTGCTIYSRNSSGTLVQTVYGMSGTTFQMTTGTTTTVIASNATVSITYYTSSSYNSNSLTTFTPSATTDASLIAVGITATVSTGGGNSTYTSFVRLNNGP